MIYLLNTLDYLKESEAADGPGNHKIAQGYSNQPVMSVPMKTLSQGRAIQSLLLQNRWSSSQTNLRELTSHR